MSEPWWNTEGEGGHLLVADPFEVWVSATQNVRGNYDWAVRLEDAFACRTVVEQGEAGTHAAAVKAALTSANVELGRMAQAAAATLRSLGGDTSSADAARSTPLWSWSGARASAEMGARFVHLLLAGTATERDFEEAVDQWHMGFADYSDQPLHEYLGLTFDEHGMIVKDGVDDAAERVRAGRVAP